MKKETKFKLGWLSLPILILSVFCIVSAELRLTSPNPGEVFQSGKTVEIAWESSSGGWRWLSFTPMGHWTSIHDDFSWYNFKCVLGNSYTWKIPHFKSDVIVYVRIADREHALQDGDEVDTLGPITILASPPDPYEMNNTREEAAPLRLGDTLDGAIVMTHESFSRAGNVLYQLNGGPDGEHSVEDYYPWYFKMYDRFRDYDWFRFEALPGTRLSFYAMPPCNPGQYGCWHPVGMRLYDSAGSGMSVASSIGNHLVYEVPEQGGGTYYLKASVRAATWSAEYRLATSAEAIEGIVSGEGAEKFHAAQAAMASDLSKKERGAINGTMFATAGQTVSIQYRMDRPGHSELAVYSAAGRRVATLWNQVHLRGTYRVIWDGMNETGQRVPNGVYFLILNSSGTVTRNRVFLCR